MILKTIVKLIFAILGVSLFAALCLWRSPPAARAFPDNCGLHPSNLFRNGSMAPGHTTPYGIVSSEWEPFVLIGAPRFEWVDNEKWDANGAQYFWSDSVAFDAGIYQTVGGLQPGVYYRFRIGYSHARLDPGNAKNEVHPSMGRQVGVDPLGGTDARSPNVLWGPELFNSGAGMNPAELTMTFAARADKATMYFRGIFRGASGRAKVWFDVACMEPLPAMPTATPVPPTAKPIPPTATPRPPTRPPVTKIARAPSATPTPTVTTTPKPSPTPTVTMTPRYARPEVTPVPTSPIGLNADTLTGLGTLSVTGAFVFWSIGLVLWRGLR